MREILFRGKRTDNGEWVEGAYFKHEPLCVCVSEEKQPDKHLIVFDGFCDWGFEPPINCVEVLPETVGQFTGLTDKNGKRIFEGDIVLVPYIDPIFKYTWNDTSPCEWAIVKHCNGMFYVEYIEAGDKFTLSAMDGYMKIIGNIYDNPELLGGNG